MLTAFGKFCRKIRIDREELLKNMADKLDVTPAYLSAVEIGKRNVPIKWIEQISRIYELSKEQHTELVEAVEISQSKINLRGMREDDKKLVLTFARGVNELSESEKKQLLAFFRK